MSARPTGTTSWPPRAPYWTIANPDLVERWQNGHPENEPRPEHFCAPHAEGYTDYPFHQAD